MPVVGYRYLFGIHMGICRAADELVEVRVGDRTAWRGSVTSNQHVPIDAYDLFGGEDGEGGVSGDMCVMMGGPTQEACPGLVSMIRSGNLTSDSIVLNDFVVVSTNQGAKAEFGLRANGTAFKIENGVTTELAGMWITGAPIPDGASFPSYYEGYWISDEYPGDNGPLPIPLCDVGEASAANNMAGGIRMWVEPGVNTSGRFEIRTTSQVIIRSCHITLNAGPADSGSGTGQGG